MTTPHRQKSPLAIRISDELETYLRQRAADGHRTMSNEIRMRLEQSRQADQQPTTKEQQQ